MSAISGTRRAAKELADGTLRVQIDIDPRFKAQFHALFPSIDMPVAIAPLVSDFERKEEKPKSGPLCVLAAQWCKDERFWEFIDDECGGGKCSSEEDAAVFVRVVCGVNSRAELDSDQHAASKFQKHIRAPFMNWMERTWK